MRKLVAFTCFSDRSTRRRCDPSSAQQCSQTLIRRSSPPPNLTCPDCTAGQRTPAPASFSVWYSPPCLFGNSAGPYQKKHNVERSVGTQQMLHHKTQLPLLHASSFVYTSNTKPTVNRQHRQGNSAVNQVKITKTASWLSVHAYLLFVSVSSMG